MVPRNPRTLLIVLGVLVGMAVTWRVLAWLFRLASWIALPILLLTAVFLILLILIQRGKGGGLAGAFGGLGGQSAFGTKAGDTFTRITIGVAAFWIFLCVVSVRALTTTTGRLNVGTGRITVEEGAKGQPSGKGADSAGESETGNSGGSAPVSGDDSGAGAESPAGNTDGEGS